MSRAQRVFAMIAVLVGALAWNARETRWTEPGFDDAAGDSAYQANLRIWQRDSAVLDSVTRGVNTATLYALYRQALGKEGVTLRLMTELGCEELRLGIRYGGVPWERASRAVRDTVYRDIGVTDALDYIARHAPDEGMVATGQNCRPFPPRAPEKIGETRLDVEFPRPWTPSVLKRQRHR